MNWKRALMWGAFGAGAFLFATGKRPVAMALAGVGLAVLASEHPDQFEQIWERAPQYLERAARVANGVSQFVERMDEARGTELLGERASRC